MTSWGFFVEEERGDELKHLKKVFSKERGSLPRFDITLLLYSKNIHFLESILYRINHPRILEDSM